MRRLLLAAVLIAGLAAVAAMPAAAHPAAPRPAPGPRRGPRRGMPSLGPPRHRRRSRAPARCGCSRSSSSSSRLRSPPPPTTAHAIDCALRTEVLPHLAAGRPNLVVFDEDIGLETIAVGPRGAAARALLAQRQRLHRQPCA